MLLKSVSAVAFLAVASHAMADKKVSMSTRDLFGMARRQTDAGYSPTDTFCGMGATCAEACGEGFETCSSNDNSIHCFNALAKQVCCPDDSGNSCDAGYFCASAANSDTICCLEGQSLDECAKAHQVTGALVSQVPKPKTTSTSSSSTSTSSSSSSTPITSTTARQNTTTSYSVAHNTTTAYSTGAYTSTTCLTTVSAAPTNTANGTAPVVVPPPTTGAPSPPVVPVASGAGAMAGSALVAVVAAAAAAFL